MRHIASNFCLDFTMTDRVTEGGGGGGGGRRLSSSLVPRPHFSRRRLVWARDSLQE